MSAPQLESRFTLNRGLREDEVGLGAGHGYSILLFICTDLSCRLYLKKYREKPESKPQNKVKPANDKSNLTS